MAEERKVCIAVGPSAEAQAALRWASRAFLQSTDSVYLLNIIPST